MMFRLAPFALLLACAFAFQANLPNRMAAKMTSVARPLIMSDEETEAMLRTIQDCSEHTQCGVDDVANLLDELNAQEKEMTARLEHITKLIQQLKHLNEKEEDRDSVRAFVQDMLRVFSTQGAQAFPSGFAGDIGDGPMTAYDALPPKKWKPQASESGK